jgi:hypothetical protein
MQQLAVALVVLLVQLLVMRSVVVTAPSLVAL